MGVSNYQISQTEDYYKTSVTEENYSSLQSDEYYQSDQSDEYYQAINTEEYYQVTIVEETDGLDWTLTASGDGSGVLGFAIKTAIDSILTLTGGAKVYSDPAGTLNESTTKSITATLQTSLYIRLSSGTGSFTVNTDRVTFVLISSPTNAPTVSGSITPFSELTYLNLQSANSKMSGSITNMTGLTILRINTAHNEGIITGDVSNHKLYSQFSLTDPSGTRIPGSRIIVGGTLTQMTEHPSYELVADGDLTFTGDLTPVDPHWFYAGGVGVWTNVYATLDAWTECYYLENDCPNITVNTIAGMTTCGYFQPSAIILNETQVNQILADMWANVDVVKGYGASETTRTFDLRCAEGTAAPSGQGLIDKQALIDWVGATGQTNNVYTR